jgi:rubrerythrin
LIPAETLVAKLQDDLTRKTYSLIEYVTMASPYVPEGKGEMWDLLLKLRGEERGHSRILSRLIVDLGGIPAPGLFDEGAADTNYLNIVYLYGLLIRHKESSVRELQERVADTAGYPGARTVILQVLADEERNLAELKECHIRHAPKPPLGAVPEQPALKASEPVARPPAPEQAAKGGFDLQAFLAKKKAAASTGDEPEQPAERNLEPRKSSSKDASPEPPAGPEGSGAEERKSN